jgi:sucrose-phosphate synthase
MHIAMLNPQGNFDPKDSYLTQHPDYGGQLVYVKEVALAIAELGHSVDIVTRRIMDKDWPEFAEVYDAYDGHPAVRILRIACGPKEFLPKEQLWPLLGTEWLQGILDFYNNGNLMPDVFCAHYADGGLVGAMLQQQTGIPFTFTAHSLGAQKMDKLGVNADNLAELDQHFLFRRRIVAERTAIAHAVRIFTSTKQEWQEQYAHRAYADIVDVVGKDAARFCVTPPGVNRQVFSDETTNVDASVGARIEEALRRDVPSSRQTLPLVVNSSRLDAKKNIIGLVRAFVENEQLQASANLAIVVRGLENPFQQRDELSLEERQILDEIATLLDEHQLWHTVTAFPLNSQHELAAAYRYCAAKQSVFALSALYEPFGLAPLEAISCGLPAVVTRNGGPSESLYDAKTQTEYGILVDPADPSDIARGLLNVLQHEDTWLRLQRDGLQRVLSRYTWESTARSYLDVFNSALNHKAQHHALAPIPAYFATPTPEHDISPNTLKQLYFDTQLETL